jgi:hypothetical protein
LEYKVKTLEATMENICTFWTKPSDPMTKELDKQPTSPNAKKKVEQAKTPNVWMESEMTSSRSICKIRSWPFLYMLNPIVPIELIDTSSSSMWDYQWQKNSQIKLSLIKASDMRKIMLIIIVNFVYLPH